MIRGTHSKTLTGLLIEGDHSVNAEAADLIPHMMQMEQPWIKSFEEISALLADIDSELDVDGNGESRVFSDGLLENTWLDEPAGDDKQQ